MRLRARIVALSPVFPPSFFPGDSRKRARLLRVIAHPPSSIAPLYLLFTFIVGEQVQYAYHSRFTLLLFTLLWGRTQVNTPLYSPLSTLPLYIIGRQVRTLLYSSPLSLLLHLYCKRNTVDTPCYSHFSFSLLLSIDYSIIFFPIPLLFSDM